MRATKLIVAIAAMSILSTTGVASATSTRTFESIALDGSGIYNGSDLAGGFEQGGVAFNNDFTDFGGADPAAMNQAIRDGVDNGAALKNVVSHGNFTQWGVAPGIYQSTDVALQNNNGLARVE